MTPQVEIAIRPPVLFAGLTLDLDPTYVLVLVMIFLPFVILNALVFQPFLKLFEERHERVEGALERAGRKVDEAESKARTFEEKIQIAKKRGMEARNRIRTEAQQSVAAQLETEKSHLTIKVDEALREIGRSRETARAAVEAEARRLGELTASKLLGRGV